VDRVLFDLKHNPQSRRIMTNIYNHQDLHEMHLYPCAYSMTFNVTGNVLNAILNQRSQDMLSANNFNVCQYAALLAMFAQVSGLVAGELVHVIADAHIYDRHVPLIEKLMERKGYAAPTLCLDPKITDFYDFSTENVTLENYQYHPGIGKIPVAE
jgi:thymidylate synthase